MRNKIAVIPKISENDRADRADDMIAPEIPAAGGAALMGGSPYSLVFPPGTEFALYRVRVPVASIPRLDGGALCLAFDTNPPRVFSRHSYNRADNVTEEEFLQFLVTISCEYIYRLN
ncbi:MAG: hypothetical protein LBQ83_06755 [Candidatus Margulisbacteria bacterium]|jgi:hypothetical protein|nr:hypothetical protein [Candidatus Margulisiibacteriota bacterium]